MFRRACAVTAAAVIAPLLTFSPASTAAVSYVALGDSYASGTGTGTFIADGSSCQRSVYAYPSLIAAARGWSLNFRACSGAKIPDVTGAQLSALSASTNRVTISVGGNDAGFTDVLTECALPAWASDCAAAVAGARSYITGSLPSSLSTLYGRIRSKAPSAKVVAVGYPRIFNGEDCNALTWFSPEDEAALNATADLINSRISAAASAAGFTFVNPTSSFVGHAVCDRPEWLNGLSNPVSESYHPNRAGHANGLTPLVSGRLAAAVSVTAAVTAAAESSAGALARQQRAHADDDAAIAPERFVAPDLDSPRVRAAARAAGVDLTSRASIDRADRDAARAQAAQQ